MRKPRFRRCQASSALPSLACAGSADDHRVLSLYDRSLTYKALSGIVRLVFDTGELNFTMSLNLFHRTRGPSSPDTDASVVSIYSSSAYIVVTRRIQLGLVISAVGPWSQTDGRAHARNIAAVYPYSPISVSHFFCAGHLSDQSIQFRYLILRRTCC